MPIKEWKTNLSVNMKNTVYGNIKDFKKINIEIL